MPPVGTLTIAAPQNWVALFAFLATSLTASQLSVRAKRRTQEAVERRSEIEKLYSLSRALLLTDAAGPDAKQIVQQITLTCEFPTVSLYVRKSGEIHSAGIVTPDLHAKLRESAVRSTLVRDESVDVIITPIRLGGEPIGSLAVSGGTFSDAALHSLLNLVAIGLERAKAVTTDLLAEQPSSLQAHHQELITIVDESTDRLSKLVTDAIQLARIEGGTFRLNLAVHFPSSLVNGALRQMKSMLEERPIYIAVPEDLPPVRVDAELIQIVITHLLDNALKYSPPSHPISIEASVSDDKVILRLRDQGQGIPEQKQSQVFEKFFRGRNERHLKGTGMGLSIAREIMRAHGEDIWLTSSPDEGSEFSFSLPIAPKGSVE